MSVVLALTLFQGYRKGFVLTLCAFWPCLWPLSELDSLRRLAEPVSQMVRPAIELNINSALENSLQEQGVTLPEGSTSSQEDPGLDGLGEDFSLEQILELVGDSALVQYFSDASTVQ